MVTFCLQAPRLTLANVIIEIRMNFLIFPSETICFHIFIDKTLIMIKHQRMNVNDYHYQQKECTSEWCLPADIMGPLGKRIYGHSRFCNTDFDDKWACLNLSGVWMGFHSCAPMSSAPDVHVEENGRRGEYGALPGSLSGGEGQWNENVR